MSQDIGDNRTRYWGRLLSFSGGSLGCSGGLVVPVGVEDEVAQELAVGLVDDADLAVLDEQDDVGSGVGSAEADVVKLTCVAQHDSAPQNGRPVPSSHHFG